MGIFGPGYTRHQYREWLLTTVANLLDGDLAISSAELLRGGAIARVEVSMPDTITTPEGVAFRPNLLATTSFDGSIATTYKRTGTDTVCDNTRELALSERGQEVKVKHSRHSGLQLAPARQALQMVHSLADDFAQEVARLCRMEVTPIQWKAFLDAHIPRVHTTTGLPLTGRSLTTADRKRDTLTTLYRADPRVSPWGRHRPRRPAGREHLRAPRRSGPRRTGRTQRPEDHHRGLRPARPQHLEDPDRDPQSTRPRSPDRVNPGPRRPSGRRGLRAFFCVPGAARHVEGPPGPPQPSARRHIGTRSGHPQDMSQQSGPVRALVVRL